MTERLRIFISSPSDVRPERMIAQRVVERLDREFSFHFHVAAIRWEREPLRATEHPQAGIPLPHDSDIVVVILWSRLGVPLPVDTFPGPVTGRAVTGTEWEFENAVAGYRARQRPQLLVYRKQAQIAVFLDDEEALEQQRQQKRRLEEFLQRWFVDETSGLVKAALHAFTTAAEFEQTLEGHLRELLLQRLDRAPGAVVEDGLHWHQGSPFRGLESFELEHAPVFFGRTRARNELRELLARQAERGCAFVLVFGASGSGKSSLVKAGLLADLTVPGMIGRVALCRQAVLRPADAPADLLGGLAAALLGPTALPELTAPPLSYRRDRLAALLRAAPGQVGLPIEQGLVQAGAAAQLTAPAEARLVLVIDQLEELFSLESLTAAERAGFVAALEALARSGWVWVVATMRSDFFDRLETLPALARLSAGEARYLLTPPNQAELSQIIRQPAREAGLRFEVDRTRGLGLDDELREAASRSPAALPLLEFTLDQLWQRRTGHGVLTFAAYAELDGLEGALGQRAEEEFARLPAEVQAALPEVLRALATVGQGAITARAVPLRQFPPGSPRRRLVDAFLTPHTRLLVAEGDLTEVREGTRVRVAHEALLTHWGRAREQLRRDHADLQLRARLEQAAALWQAAPAAGRDSLLLRSGLPLAEAKDLLQRQSDELDQAVITYIEASAAAARARGRRQWRRLQATVALFAVLAVLASLAAWFAFAQQRVAQAQLEQALRNESRYLVREAQAAMREGNDELAERLSLQALPADLDKPDRPLVPEAVLALSQALAGDPLRAVLVGHKGQVTAAAFSPAGDRVVTAADGTARLWEAATGALLATLQQDGRVAAAAFSPAGDRVVTAADRTAQIWDAATGAPLTTLQQDGQVAAAAFSPAGDRILTASKDGTARLWDAATGALLTTLRGHEGPLVAAAFNPAGDRIVTAAFDRTARIWDAATGAPLTTLRGHEGPVVAAAFSPAGDRVLTASWDRTARLWDAATGAPLATLRQGGQIWSAAFSPAGDRVVTAALDGTARLWDAATGALLTTLRGHEGPLVAAAFNPAGDRIVTASFDRTARVWDTATGAALATLWHEGPVTAVAFSPAGDRIVTAADDGAVRLWQAATATALTTLRGHDGLVTSAVFSPAGDRIVTASADGTARLWEAATGTPLLVLAGHEAAVRFAAFSPAGDRVVTTAGDGTARIWDAATGTPLLTLRGHESWLVTAAFNSAGDRVVTTAGDGTARIWDAATGAALLTLRHDGPVWSAAFSPAGDRIVTACEDGMARIWDAATGALLATLRGHEGAVGAAAFSPAGDRIVTAAFDRTVRLWEATSGALLATFRGHEGPVVSVAFNRTGDRIVTGSWDGTARVWEAATGAVLASFQHEAPVWSAAFNPAGDRVATAAGLMGRLWDTRFLIATGDRPTPGDLISYAQAAAVRPLAAVKRSDLSPPEEQDQAGAGRATTGSAAVAGPGLDRCDALAGNPSDPQRVGPGVPLERLEADAAVPACRAAVAAAPGEPRYRYQLGRLLVSRQHAAEALPYLQAAAERGYVMALNDLATLYRDGDGVARDLSAAVRLYRQASERGVAEADRHLAELAWTGDGLPENRPEALRLFTRAAERGDPWSHQRLAELYERGDGVAQDLAAALVHHAAAAQQFAALGAADEAAFETARRGSLARTMPIAEVARLWREGRAPPSAAPR